MYDVLSGARREGGMSRVSGYCCRFFFFFLVFLPALCLYIAPGRSIPVLLVRVQSQSLLRRGDTRDEP